MTIKALNFPDNEQIPIVYMVSEKFSKILKRNPDVNRKEFLSSERLK